MEARLRPDATIADLERCVRAISRISRAYSRAFLPGLLPELLRCCLGAPFSAPLDRPPSRVGPSGLQADTERGACDRLRCRLRGPMRGKTSGVEARPGAT